MSYQLEVSPAGDITTDVKNVALLWTQLPDIPWDRVRKELEPWYERMSKYGVIIASRFDYSSMSQLISYITLDINRFTKPGDLIVDPFCGASTVGMIATEKDRHYFGCDISQIAIDKSESRLSVYA